MTKNRILLGAVALLMAACKTDDGPFLMPTQAIAYVRYVHAVPDHGPTDWRPIDGLENSPPALGITYRSFTPYQAMGAGARRLRIFPTSTDINVTSQHLIDTTITFAQNTYYTLIHTGRSQAGQTPADRIQVIEDPIPATNTTQVAVRLVHQGVGLNAVDAVGVDGTGATAAIASGINYAGASTYAMRAPGAFTVRVLGQGSTTVVATAAAPAGAAADKPNNLTAIGGATIAGSAMTAIVFGPSVTGTSAPQGGAFGAPAVVYIVDRHPN
jgi:hypothetical protein